MHIDGLALTDAIHVDSDTAIWRGTRARDGARVIVKCAASATAAPSVAARLQHEAGTLERLRDTPGVVRLVEVRETPRGPALVLADDGLEPLAALAARGPLPLAVALRVGASLAEALAALHRRAVVHRDIKPDNVLAAPDGSTVAIIDFGVASWIGQTPGRADAIEGTLAYMAPEQTGRTGRAVDARADLYAFGVTLYELVAGRRPFEAVDPLALLHAQLAATPPRLDVAAGAPSVVADIVARLLEKDPDARYQTAAGVAADLARCAERLAAGATVEPFPLGARDFVTRVALPDVLVGRDAERATLREAWARARAGGREVVLLAGPSGSGKTSLARTVRAEAAREGGAFLAGKHDQLDRSRPYASLVEAFGSRCARAAAASTEALAGFAARVREALGPNARLLGDVLRELPWVTGPLDPVAELGPQEQQNRLALAWRNLARAVRDEDGGLALFLDDLQWADPATLGLLGDLVGDVEGALTILSFRSDEIGPEHPLWTALDRAAERGVTVTRIDVANLDVARVGELLAAALPGAEHLEGLAARVWRRTGGNPFFAGQLLLALGARGLIARDADTGRWRWDVDAVDAAPLGDDVVALVTTRLGALPAVTLRALGVASCVGGRFDLGSVAALLDATLGDAARAVLPALELGVVTAEDGGFRAALDGAEGSGEAWLRFVHDRVQQAAWEGVDAEARALTHRALARRIGGGAVEGAARFERARHGIAALSVLDDPGERAAVVAHCLDAAAAARSAGAFDAMDGFVAGAAAALVGASADAGVAVDVAVLQLQSDVLLRRFASAEARALALLAQPLPAHLRLRVHAMRLDVAMTQGALAQGVAVAREGLAEVGVVAPEGAGLAAATMEVMGRVLAAGPTLFAADLDAFFDAPYTEVDASTDLLSLRGGLCAAVGGDGLLAGYWSALAADAMVRARRATPMSPMLFIAIGQILSTFSTDYLGASAWVRLGAELADRRGAPVRADCAVQAAHLLPHRESVERTVAAYDRAVALAFEQGAFQAISWGTTGAITYGHAWRGEALATLRERVAKAHAVVERAGDAAGRFLANFVSGWIEALRAVPAAPPSATHDLLAGGPRYLSEVGVANAAAIARPYECHARYVHGYYDACLDCADEAEAQRGAMFALPTVTDIDLWLGLAAARIAPTLTGEARDARVALVARSAERFAAYEAGCAENFAHKRKLLEGERMLLDGRAAEALGRFDAAAAEAERAGFVFVRGVALERAGETARALGMSLAARTYLEAARALYADLGADGAAASLARRHGLGAGPQAAPRSATSSSTAGTTHVRAEDYDLAAVLRAAEALGAERDPQGVVARLMALVTSSAGAERAALLLARDGQWEVAARHGDDRGDVGAPAELDAVPGAVSPALRYVARTRERVVAPHAALDARFADEARVREGLAASLVAAPLLRRGELAGIVYLEHSAPGVFTPSRAALLEMLAGLGAVAWENARLVSALQEANAGLERQIAARTAQLDRALAELWTEMDLATRIQTALLPEDGARGPWDVAAAMRPAERVGGDYYDVFAHRGRLWVLVGDVSGHGVNAGLVMMMVQAAVRAVVRALDGDEALSPARLLATVNGALRYGLGRIGRGQYMTITAMRLDDRGAVHAGLHQDLFVRRAATGAVEQVPTQGFWLGIVDELAPMLVDTPLALDPGDAVVLYTDGVTESRAGDELLGLDPVRDAVARCGDAAPAEVVRAVLALLEGRVVDDDVTVLCLRRS